MSAIFINYLPHPCTLTLSLTSYVPFPTVICEQIIQTFTACKGFACNDIFLMFLATGEGKHGMFDQTFLKYHFYVKKHITADSFASEITIFSLVSGFRPAVRHLRACIIVLDLYKFYYIINIILYWYIY